MTLGLVVRNNEEAVLLSDTLTTWEYEGVIAGTNYNKKKYLDYESENLLFRMVNAGHVDEAGELMDALKNIKPTSNKEALDTIRATMQHIFTEEANKKNERAQDIWRQSSLLISDPQRRAEYLREKEIDSAREDVKARIPSNSYIYVGKDRDGVHAYYFFNGEYNFISSPVYGIGTGGRTAETFAFPTLPMSSLARSDLLATALLAYQRATTIPTVGGIPDIILIGDDTLKFDRKIAAVLANYAGARSVERITKKEYARAIDAGLEGDMEKTLQNLERLGESRQSMIDYAHPLSYWVARSG